MLSVLADVGGLMAGGLEGAWFVFCGLFHFPVLCFYIFSIYLIFLNFVLYFDGVKVWRARGL